MTQDLLSISLDQVKAMFPSKEINKAYPYVQHVSKIANDGAKITARVQGSSRSPYQVTITQSGAYRRMLCSCPVGSSCKHTAATLLSIALANQAKPVAKPTAALASLYAPSRRIAPSFSLAEHASLGRTRTRDFYAKQAAEQRADSSEDSSAAAFFAATLGSSILWDLSLSSSNGASLRPIWHTPESPGDTPGPANSRSIPTQDLICAHVNRDNQSPRLTRNFDAAFIQDLIAVFDETDQALCAELFAEFQRTKTPPQTLPLAGKELFSRLASLSRSGRLLCSELSAYALRFVPEASPALSWSFDPLGRLRAQCLGADGDEWTLADTWPPLAIHSATGSFALPDAEPAVLRRILCEPFLDHPAAVALRDDMERFGSSTPPPPCSAPAALQGKPTPALTISSVPPTKMPRLALFGGGSYPWHASSTGERLQGSLAFDFGGPRIPHTIPDGVAGIEGLGWVDVQIDRNIRKAAIATLASHGMAPALDPARLEHILQAHGPELSTEEADGLRSWRGKFAEDRKTYHPGHNFRTAGVQALRAAQWIVETAERAPSGPKKPAVAGSIDAAISLDNGWFQMDIGVMVDAKRYDLAPILSQLFQKDPRWLSRSKLEAIPDDESVLVEPEGLRAFTCAARRIKPFALHMADLILRASQGSLKIKADEADELERAAEACGAIDSTGLDSVRRAFSKVRQSWKPDPAEPPAGLHATLRPYQRDGLDWMAHLARNNLAGILADDMGLGKTIQCLAHVLREKELGYAKAPSLVILPTSLAYNWAAEAAKFAPSLRILTLHGSERHGLFSDIAQSDLVITTYPLLWRDLELYRKKSFHLLILDEAQNVKNINARSSSAIRALKAQHKLCITGTPIENNLSELHAQFDFLLPGYLGTASDFKSRWATPIEKQGRTILSGYLASKVRPFLLRRMKEQVASELPPKTIAVRSAQFAEPQRDLYESVRSAMDLRVRQALDASGMAKSQIVILDALLKLRQVCNDPSLCPTPHARKVKASAKMELIKELVPELLAQKRKILIFSQFTSMLAIIEAELAAQGVAYSKLTGQTKKREEPIRRFQEGEADVFLISLKAGGSGLNLTAADTVIHVDPWWNPAAENQATDRAHRIGQTKPVLVLKLIIEGSIEEKILALQERKAHIANGILVADSESGLALTRSDIDALFAPIPSLDAAAEPKPSALASKSRSTASTPPSAKARIKSHGRANPR